MANNHRDRREREDFTRNKQPKETVRSEPPLGEYFLSGEGIDRQVLQSSICRFLGPEATSRPYEHEVYVIYGFHDNILMTPLGRAGIQDSRSSRIYPGILILCYFINSLLTSLGNAARFERSIKRICVGKQCPKIGKSRW